MEEQDEFFKKKKEKQKEGGPVKFEPRGPVKFYRDKSMPPSQYLIKYLGDQEIVDIAKDNLIIG